MRRICAILAAACSLAGCGTDLTHATATTVAPTKGPVGEPSLQHSTKLSLKVNPADLASAQIFVGDTEDTANKVFIPPKDAYDFRDLPPGFQQPYKAAGFQNKTFGFGAIY